MTDLLAGVQVPEVDAAGHVDGQQAVIRTDVRPGIDAAVSARTANQASVSQGIAHFPEAQPAGAGLAGTDQPAAIARESRTARRHPGRGLKEQFVRRQVEQLQLVVPAVGGQPVTGSVESERGAAAAAVQCPDLLKGRTVEKVDVDAPSSSLTARVWPAGCQAR